MHFNKDDQLQPIEACGSKICKGNQIVRCTVGQ